MGAGLSKNQADQGATPNGTALQEEQERFAGFGRWSWSRATGLTLSSGVAQLLLPLTPPTSGRSVIRRMPRESRRRFYEALRRARQNRESNELTFDLVVGADASRTFSMSVHVDAEQPVRLSGLVREASTATQLSAALQRSESRWEIALASARQGVWDSDVATGLVYHSRTWRAIRGMDPDGPGRGEHDDWVGRLHPNDRERILEDIRQQHLGQQMRIAMEYRERLDDGRYIWISSLGAPVEWFADGRARRIIGTDTDITERKEAEVNMALLSRRLELALKVTGIGVFDINLNTTQSFWDTRLREIYGLPPDEPVTAESWMGMLHPEDVPEVVRDYQAAMDKQDGFHSQFRILRRDGAERIIRAESVRYVDENGAPHLLGTNADVTEEVESRRDLQRAKELLEMRNVALEEAKQRIEHNSLHDMLTGLPNRRYLDRVLRERVVESRIEGGAVGVLHIDLDRFKQINDTLGHAAGDAMLVHAAELLKRSLVPGEFVARIGGDEFVIVCPIDKSAARLEELAAGVIRQMRVPVPYDGHHCRFGASVGIAMQGGKEADPAQLLVDADIALYRAKARGKNGYEFFTEALQAEAVRTKEVADDILRGLEQQEFVPYYQPLFDARTRQIVSVEALARWKHPVKGLLMPPSFLKVAEDLSVVNSIDHAILKAALADYRSWERQGGIVPEIAVNVSFRRLLDEQLLESLKTLNMPAGVVSFELLESIYLDDVEDIVGWNIAGIRDLGIGLSIDDFGTGHASILGLLRLRPDQLKIDRQFLDGIETSSSQRGLVRSLIDIGKSLGITVVAEGVETQMQAGILTELGCDLLQGFALARPMSGESFAGELRERRRSA
jgi:diguanylate cyclase (GGDEF)-like protein/PAS domain S-box-containing protein